MRYVDRGSDPAPGALSKLVKGKTELDLARAFYGAMASAAPADPAAKPKKKAKSYGFKVYKDDEVRARLEALFHGKCAYCETVYASSAPVDVEHFRPKGGVEGEPQHPGYWWLAMVWDNLLPSCIDCNRRRKQKSPNPTSGSLVTLDEQARVFSSSRIMLSGKKDMFPITGPRRATNETDDLALESPLLLDPCRDKPDEHLLFHVDVDRPIGLVLARPANGAGALPLASPTPLAVAAAAGVTGVSGKGAVSIQLYGLNRLGLVQERTRIQHRLEFLEMMMIELQSIIQKLKPNTDADVIDAVKRLEQLFDRVVNEMNVMAESNAPYSAMVTAWKDGLRARLMAPPSPPPPAPTRPRGRPRRQPA